MKKSTSPNVAHPPPAHSEEHNDHERVAMRLKTDEWSGGSFIMVGVSRQAAPLEVREHLVLSAGTCRDLAPGSMPNVLLSTCNRLEVYSWADGHPLHYARELGRALARVANMPLNELEPYLVTATGGQALRHLVRVASGLDSLILGEEQIRGQVRAAFREAVGSTVLPAPLVGVFERALQAARDIRVETPLGGHPSIASAGVELAMRTPELAGRRDDELHVLVLGAGIMAKAALARLAELGTSVTLINRTVEHAQKVANGYGPRVDSAGFNALPELLKHADLVVCSTASRQPVLDCATLEAALRRRSMRPLVVLDVALPRDVEARARAMPGVRLIDLDDLEQLCPADTAQRAAERERVEAQAARAAGAIEEWLRIRASASTIVQFRARGHQIRSHELRRVAFRLRNLSAVESAAVDELTERIVNKLLHTPTVALRQRAGRRTVNPDDCDAAH
jgi:glutamyl-tRNA reductase